MGSNYLALISNNWQAGLPFSSGDLGLCGSGHEPCRRGDLPPREMLQAEVVSTGDTPVTQEAWQARVLSHHGGLLRVGLGPLAEFSKTFSRRWERVVIMKG